jgi:hypothetical protein
MSDAPILSFPYKRASARAESIHSRLILLLEPLDVSLGPISGELRTLANVLEGELEIDETTKSILKLLTNAWILLGEALGEAEHLAERLGIDHVPLA